MYPSKYVDVWNVMKQNCHQHSQILNSQVPNLLKVSPETFQNFKKFPIIFNFWQFPQVKTKTLGRTSLNFQYIHKLMRDLYLFSKITFTRKNLLNRGQNFSTNRTRTGKSKLPPRNSSRKFHEKFPRKRIVSAKISTSFHTSFSLKNLVEKGQMDFQKTANNLKYISDKNKR